MAPCHSLFSYISIFSLTHMFFIVFVLFFSKHVPVNSIQCLTKVDGIMSTSSSCEFELDINDPIPSDTVLTATASKCAIHNADLTTILGSFDGSCYGEISIDYDTGKMRVKLTGVTVAHSLISPYDDMFGVLNGIKSVVQYKINGNLEKEKIQMITRIQCKTYDNCAIDKLRKLLQNLTISNTRRNIFKELIKFLNTPESTEVSQLTCLDDNNDDVQCADDEKQCKFDRSKTGLTKGCASEGSTSWYDLEYRFNVIEEISDSGTDNSAPALKCFYLCNTDTCNSDDHFQKVDNLLTAFAMASSSTSENTDSNNNNKPNAHTNNKGRSDGVSFIISFYLRSIIIFSVFIQILSN